MNNALMILRASPCSSVLWERQWSQKTGHSRVIVTHGENFVFFCWLKKSVPLFTFALVGLSPSARAGRRAGSLRSLNGHRNAARYMKQPVKHYAKTLTRPPESELRPSRRLPSYIFLYLFALLLIDYLYSVLMSKTYVSSFFNIQETKYYSIL